MRHNLCSLFHFSYIHKTITTKVFTTPNNITNFVETLKNKPEVRITLQLITLTKNDKHSLTTSQDRS